MTEQVEVWSRQWIRPRLTTYTADGRAWTVLWNRYNEIPYHDSGVTIGVVLVMGSRVVGLRWARPVVSRREA